MLNEFILVVILAASIASVSFTVARTKITAPLRQRVKRKSDWLGNLFGCPYCVSHWLTFAAVAIYRPRLLNFWWVTDYLVTIFVSVTISAILIGFITRAIAPTSASTAKPTPPVAPPKPSVRNVPYDGHSKLPLRQNQSVIDRALENPLGQNSND